MTQSPGPEPTVLEKLRDQPSPFLLTGYAVEQVLWMVPLVLGLVLFVVGGLLVVVWVGIFLVAAAVPLIRVIANRQRHIAGRVLGVELPPPYRPLPERGPLVRLVAMLTDPMTWRDVLWIVWAIARRLGDVTDRAGAAAGRGHRVLLVVRDLPDPVDADRWSTGRFSATAAPRPSSAGWWRSPRAGPRPWTTRRPSCAGWSATCTTGRRLGWSPCR